jgi:hypothetical protein
LAASLLFRHWQTTERTVIAAQQLRRTLGVPARVVPHWDELVVELDHSTFPEIVPATPLGIHMGKVLAVQTIKDQVCGGTMSNAAARQALVAAERMPSVPILRFAAFAAIGAASLGVIYGLYDVASLTLIAVSAGVGALIRRWQGKLGGKLCRPCQPRTSTIGCTPTICVAIGHSRRTLPDETTRPDLTGDKIISQPSNPCLARLSGSLT